MGGTPNKPRRHQTTTRQIGSDNKNKHTEKRKRTKILPGSNTISVKVHQKCISTDRYTQKTTEKSKRMDLDRKTHRSVQRFKEINHPVAMPSALQFEKRKYPNNRRKYKRTRGYTVAKTKRRKSETGWLSKQIFIGHREEICNKRARATSRSVGTGAFSLICLWKAN